MPIQILPARLANQIAAGEVVERPASVIKELVENSLDAGATTVKIQIEKGGAKRIKITDNGSGITKDELTLALSRHATSKIKTLNDLEGICSLGFRGEALASISSVSRLTLTSKPKDQESAWQAIAEGRDMQVEVTPAAHPNGTTIDVKDLFFNTPARRKFLRTDKTEFTHIEEVVKRIALARLDVTFILIHNDKLIKQYRAATHKGQYSKRVAQICGQKFIDHAIEVECEHNDLHFSGWLAKPSFVRNQNDLCYSYVNGRMMKDKLINHAIRQAYENLLPQDTYPAFVLFLTLNHRDVDVNVHPAKHEVRFHQGRYVHDFIFSVCQRALRENIEGHNASFVDDEAFAANQTDTQNVQSISNEYVASTPSYTQSVNKQYAEQDYIKPLTQVRENVSPRYQAGRENYSSQVSGKAVDTYHGLISNAYEQPDANNVSRLESGVEDNDNKSHHLLHLVDPKAAIITVGEQLRLLSLPKLQLANNRLELNDKWEQGFIGQPLLLPVKLMMDENNIELIEKHRTYIENLGFVVTAIDKSHIQVRQFPALLRHKDVASSFIAFIESLLCLSDSEILDTDQWLLCFSKLQQQDKYELTEAVNEFNKAKRLHQDAFENILLLNSVPVDLTSEISQLMSL